MKKLIGALALAAMVATSAFAEVSFGAWLCTLPTLIASDGDGVKGAGISNPWGWGTRPARLDINWTSDDGKAGMTMGAYSGYDGSLGGADAMDFWIKPVDQVKITIGKMDNFNGLRGDLCFGSWNWLRPNNTKDGFWGEGITFSAVSDTGIGLQIFPVEALQIFASLPLATSSTSAAYGDTVVKRMDKAFGAGKVGAAYAIDGIGKLKVQFLGQYDTNAAGKSKMGTLEAAFDLTAVDKLYATVGIAFTAADSDYFSTGDTMFKLAVGASYGITEAFKLSGDFALSIPKDGDMGMGFGVGLDYAVSDALGLAADVRMLMPQNNVDPSLSFLVGGTYAVGSNASLGLGFQAVVGLGDKSQAGNLHVVKAATVDGETKKFIFAVPLRASIWF